MKKPFLKIYSFILIMLFLAVSCKKDTLITGGAETLIRNAVDEGDLPSVAACIIKNDQTVWKFAYGYANREEGKPASDETSYLLASISKTITGTAVMQLHENGLIDLDIDVSQYLPFSVRHPQYPDVIITTRMILAHRSGLGYPSSIESSFYITQIIIHHYGATWPLVRIICIQILVLRF